MMPASTVRHLRSDVHHAITCSSGSDLSDVEDSDEATAEPAPRDCSISPRLSSRERSPELIAPPRKRQRLTSAPTSIALPDALFLLGLLKVPLIDRRVSVDMDASSSTEIPAALEDLVEASTAIVRALQHRPRSGLPPSLGLTDRSAASTPRTAQIARALCQVIAHYGPAGEWAVQTLQRYHIGTAALGASAYPINDLLIAIHFARHLDPRLNRLANPRITSNQLHAIRRLLDCCARATADLLPRSSISPGSCDALLDDIFSRTLDKTSE